MLNSHCFLCLILHPNVGVILFYSFRVIPFSSLRSHIVLEIDHNLDISNIINFSILIQMAFLRVEMSTFTLEYFSTPLPNKQCFFCVCIGLVLPNTTTCENTADYSDLFSDFFTLSAFTPSNPFILIVSPRKNEDLEILSANVM